MPKVIPRGCETVMQLELQSHWHRYCTQAISCFFLGRQGVGKIGTVMGNGKNTTCSIGDNNSIVRRFLGL